MTMMSSKKAAKRRLLAVPRLFHRQKKKKLEDDDEGGEEHLQRQNSQTPLIAGGSGKKNSNSKMAQLVDVPSTADTPPVRNKNTKNHSPTVRSTPSKRHLQTDGSSAEKLQSMLEAVAAAQKVGETNEEDQEKKKDVSPSTYHGGGMILRRPGSGGINKTQAHRRDTKPGRAKQKNSPTSTSRKSKNAVILAPPPNTSTTRPRRSPQSQQKPQRSFKTIASDESSGRKLESIVARVFGDENELGNKNKTKITVSTADTRTRTERGAVAQAFTPDLSYPKATKPQYAMEDRRTPTGANSRRRRQHPNKKNNTNSRMPIYNDCNGETYILVKCGGGTSSPDGAAARGSSFCSSASHKSISTCSMDSILEDPDRLQMERDRYNAILDANKSPPPPPPRGVGGVRKKVTFANRHSFSDWTQDFRFSVLDAYERWFSCD